MLSSLFPTLFDMSISASVLIAAVLLFRFFSHRFPKKYLLLLWAVVLFRLLCPIQPESNLSVIPPETVSFAQDTTLSYPERTEISVLSAADAALRAVGDAANGGLDTIFIDMDKAASDGDAVPFVNAYHDQVWLLFLEKIYPVGIVGLLFWQMSVSLRLKRRLKIAAPYDSPIPAGLLPQNTRVMSADGITGAFILGIIRPVIYLPSDLSAEAAPYVLAHEGVHLSRRDPLWKALAFLALCLHWYNPLVWAAFLCSASDMEYACDEAALRRLSAVSETADENLAASYAQTLLSLSAPKTYKFSMLSLDAGNVGGRIRRLLTAKPKRALCILMAVCCILLCLFFIGNPPTAFDADDVRMCSLNGLELPAEQGAALVDAINDANRSVNRTYDAVGQNTLDRLAVVTFADGSYLEVNYLYVSEYSFNPAHPGEDDYTTVLWHRDALGNSIGTWVMEYDFDAWFHDWMTESKVLSVDSYDWYFTRGFIDYASSEQPLELYNPALQPETQQSVPMNVVLLRLENGRYEFITGDWDINRSTLDFRLKESSTDTVQYDVDVYRDTGDFLHTVTAVMERQEEGLSPVLKLYSTTEEGSTQWIFTSERLKAENNGTLQLTLDDVIVLSERNMGLTWEDFAPYKSMETGSGLYIRVYEIDETFELRIGGGSPMGTPMYIYLARKDDLDTRIDIRYGGVEEFIEENKAESILHAPADSETGLAVVVTADGLTYDLPMLAVPYDKSVDYDRLPEITVSDDCVIQFVGFAGDTLRVGEDYYENRGESTHIDQQTLTLSADNNGVFSLSGVHRNPLREESAVYYVAAEDTRYCFWIRYVIAHEKQPADLSYTKIQFQHVNTLGQTVHAELKIALPNDWDIAYGYNPYEVVPFAEYAVIQNGDDTIGGVGFLPYSVPDDQADIPEAIFNQISMGGMSFWDIHGHFDVVTGRDVPFCTALTSVLYSADLFGDGADRKNSAIVTYHPEYALYFAIQFNDGIQNRTLLTEEEVRLIAESIEWVTVRYSDTGNAQTEQSALFRKTTEYLEEEFHRVYDPYYDILNLSIYDWTENGTEATFLYTMTFQYREEQYADLSPWESNFYFKVTENGDTLDLYCNVSPTGVEWEACQIDDFVSHQ